MSDFVYASHYIYVCIGQSLWEAAYDDDEQILNTKTAQAEEQAKHVENQDSEEEDEDSESTRTITEDEEESIHFVTIDKMAKVG